MVTLKQFAQAYEPQQMKNIANLETVDANVEIKQETRKNKDNEEYDVSFIVVEKVEYRVPASVIEQLKAILAIQPDLNNFKVGKTGEGMATKYQVIPLK